MPTQQTTLHLVTDGQLTFMIGPARIRAQFAKLFSKLAIDGKPSQYLPQNLKAIMDDRIMKELRR